MADPEIVPNEDVAIEPVVTPKEEVVSKAQFDAIVAEMGSLKAAYADAGAKLQVVDKVAALLTGKPESTLTKDEQAVVAELQRLMPHILPNAKFLDKAPELIKAVDAAQKGAAAGLVQAAYGYQLELQQAAGVKIDDPKVNFYVGTAIKEWMNQDNSRRTRFWQGDRTVIKEGFDEVSSALLSPTRVSAKRTTMETVNGRPKSASPASGAGVQGTEGSTVDFTNKQSVRAAFKAALNG